MTSISQLLSIPSDRSALVLSLKNYIAQRSQEIRDLHDNGASGLHIAIRLTGLTDTVISEIYNYELRKYEDSHHTSISDQCVLVTVGGYGRGELNPYSDIDIMFLYRSDAKKAIGHLSTEVLYLLWDLKYTIGHSIRTIEDCVKIGNSDFTARTALMEARMIAGSEALFTEFQDVFIHKVIARNVRSYIEERLRYMRERYKQYGSSIYLVEPNIKEGKGGLRDIHGLKWVTIARYRIYCLSEFHKRGYISKVGYNELIEAQDFLLRIRNDLHFHAGKAADVLTAEDQWRIAQSFGYKDAPHCLAVEAFMKDYYRHASHIHDISTRAIEKAIPSQLWRQGLDFVTSRQIKPCFVLTKNTIHVPERQQEIFFSDMKNVVYLFYLALVHGLKISTHTMSMLYRNSERVANDLYLSIEINKLFRSIISWPNGISEILRQMHKVKVLQKLIPEFEKISCHASYDYYHKYTVDEHSFLSVQLAEELKYAHGYIPKVYREIKRKDILHLALLLHDIGKGGTEHHAIAGARIAERVARQLGFSSEETSLLVFLVRAHLNMSLIAFRRDLSEDKVILLFAREVARPELLKKLFVLTYADIRAVGPDTWNEWKENLLTDLYYKTMEELSGTRAIYSEEDIISRIKKDIGEKLCLIYSPEWLDEQLHSMEPRYLLITPPEKIMNHLHMVNKLKEDKEEQVLVDVSTDKGVVEFTVYTYDNIIPGLFSKIAGVLAAAGYNILGAQVCTTQKGIVVDTFQAQDPYPEGVSSLLRQATVRKHICEALTGEATVEHLFEKYANKRPRKKAIPITAPTQVEIDNESSDEFTIMDIFAADRQGLLYVITKTIHALGLSVYSSKIATHVDQIVDVFYVKDLAGNKVTTPERIAEIKQQLLDAIEEYWKTG
ncbi:MAG: [protein-PII] uridylyltransferase [Nitrospirae bacterium]|nr:[protein-PII] uridylyltransferase [Nitrospirota bacterium]